MFAPVISPPPRSTMAPGMSLFSVNAVIILAADDGSRLLAKYFTPPHQALPVAGLAASVKLSSHRTKAPS